MHAVKEKTNWIGVRECLNAITDIITIMIF